MTPWMGVHLYILSEVITKQFNPRTACIRLAKVHVYSFYSLVLHMNQPRGRRFLLGRNKCTLALFKEKKSICKNQQTGPKPAPFSFCHTTDNNHSPVFYWTPYWMSCIDIGRVVAQLKSHSSFLWLVVWWSTDIQTPFLLHPLLLPPGNKSWIQKNQTHSLYQAIRIAGQAHFYL